jgi:hypothetical protein
LPLPRSPLLPLQWQLLLQVLQLQLPRLVLLRHRCCYCCPAIAVAVAPLRVCAHSLSLVLWSDGGRWWDVVMAGGLCIRKRKAGERVGCRKPETEPQWLGFRHAVLNKGGRCWWMLVGLFVRGNGSHGAVGSQTRTGERGWGPKTRNRA